LSKGEIISKYYSNAIKLKLIPVQVMLFLVWILFAFIKEKSINECLDIALKLAALKLQNVGRLPDNILSKLL
jgi:hypothetical protein